jgi:hypothetical protein
MSNEIHHVFSLYWQLMQKIIATKTNDDTHCLIKKHIVVHIMIFLKPNNYIIIKIITIFFLYFLECLLRFPSLYVLPHDVLPHCVLFKVLYLCPSKVSN